ncbi:MAG: PAS domain S-box protein, partial [Burkholderiales bacterium]
MNWNIFQWRLLKNKVTFVTLIIFLIGMWLLALYACWMLREDMHRVAGQLPAKETFVSILRAMQQRMLLATLLLTLTTGVLIRWLIRHQLPTLIDNTRMIDAAGCKQVEQSLAANEAWYRSIFENANTGIASADSDGRLTSFNEAFRAMLGYSAEVLQGMKYADFTHPDDRQQELDYFYDILAGKRDRYRITKRYIASDGRLLWVNLSVSLIGNTRGKAAHFLGVIQDITERKQAEEELRIAATAFESQEAMVVTDSNGVILRVNHAFTESTGYTAAEVIGQTPRLLKSGRHDDAFYATMWEDLIWTGAWQGELWDRRKDQVKKFSGGMKRRLEIARGFLHTPKILFLDEPTLGL